MMATYLRRAKIAPDRCGDIGFDFSSMTADAGVAGFADRGASFVDFLNHRSDEAGEFRNLARQDRFPPPNASAGPLAATAAPRAAEASNTPKRFISFSF